MFKYSTKNIIFKELNELLKRILRVKIEENNRNDICNCSR